MTIKELANLKQDRLKDILYDETSLDELKSLDSLISANTIIDINSKIKDLKNKKKESKKNPPIKKYQKGGIVTKPKKYQTGGTVTPTTLKTYPDTLGTGSSFLDSLTVDYLNKINFDFLPQTTTGYFGGLPPEDQRNIMNEVWATMTEGDMDRALEELDVEMDDEPTSSSGASSASTQFSRRDKNIQLKVNRYNEIQDEIAQIYGEGGFDSDLVLPGLAGKIGNFVVDPLTLGQLNYHGGGFGPHARSADLKNEQQAILKYLNDVHDLVFINTNQEGEYDLKYGGTPGGKIHLGQDLLHKDNPVVPEHMKEFEPWEYTGTPLNELIVNYITNPGVEFVTETVPELAMSDYNIYKPLGEYIAEKTPLLGANPSPWESYIPFIPELAGYNRAKQDYSGNIVSDLIKEAPLPLPLTHSPKGVPTQAWPMALGEDIAEGVWDAGEYVFSGEAYDDFVDVLNSWFSP